jgi:hypothetical protein
MREAQMSTDVFLSVGRTYLPEQEAFVADLEATLRGVGVNPRTVGRSDFSSRAPLKRIAEVLDECHGTVVLAFERAHASQYVDRPGSPQQNAIEDVRLPTVWNQIEAAISYVKDKPLLVLVERGLRDEGLLEARYDWYVQWIPLDRDALNTAEFRAVLDDWAKRVKAHETELANTPTRTTDPKNLTVKEVLGALTVPQLWAAAAAIVSILAAVAAVAYKLGTATG